MKITRKDCSRSLFISICSVIVISGILPITAFVYSDKIIENMVPMVELFKSNGLLGCLIYMLIYFIWVPLCIPSSLLTLLGSHLFTQTYGVLLGSILCYFAILISHVPTAFMCFTIFRKCFKQKI